MRIEDVPDFEGDIWHVENDRAPRWQLISEESIAGGKQILTFAENPSRENRTTITAWRTDRVWLAQDGRQILVSSRTDDEKSRLFKVKPGASLDITNRTTGHELAGKAVAASPDLKTIAIDKSLGKSIPLENGRSGQIPDLFLLTAQKSERLNSADLLKKKLLQGAKHGLHLPRTGLNVLISQDGTQLVAHLPIEQTTQFAGPNVSVIEHKETDLVYIWNLDNKKQPPVVLSSRFLDTPEDLEFDRGESLNPTRATFFRESVVHFNDSSLIMARAQLKLLQTGNGLDKFSVTIKVLVVARQGERQFYVVSLGEYTPAPSPANS